MTKGGARRVENMKLALDWIVNTIHNDGSHYKIRFMQ